MDSPQRQSDGLRCLKSSGASDGHGNKYEYKVAALAFLRCLNRTDGFYLCANVAGTGAFDDLVVKYKPRGCADYRSCFVQCKHNKDGTRRVNIDNLTLFKDDFSMKKYYKSYCEIASNTETELFRKYCVLFDVNFDKCDFIVYTNANLENSLITDYMSLSDCMSESNKILKEVFGTWEKDSEQPTYVIQDKDGAIRTKVQAHINDERKKESQKKGDEKKTMDIAKELKRVKTWEELNDVVGRYSLDGFLRSLQWFVKQASEDNLDELIQSEIETALKNNKDESPAIAKRFIENIQTWWETAKEMDVITESSAVWQDIIDARLLRMNTDKVAEVSITNISYVDEEINAFHASLTDTRINVTSASRSLSIVKIMQTMKKHHTGRFVFTSCDSVTPEVVNVWKSAWCDVLVIEVDNVTSLNDTLGDVPQGKHIILLSQVPVPGYKNIPDRFDWMQLEKESQQRLLEKIVNFQGCDVALDSVMGTHCTHAITSDVVSQLVAKDSKLVICKKLIEELSYYIPRSLERQDFVTKKIFKLRRKDDFFVISNVAEQDVAKLERSYGVKLKNYEETQGEVSHRFLWIDVMSEQDFTKFYSKIPRKNVHWLSQDSNGSVYWKQSHNDVTVVKENVDVRKRSCKGEDVDERVVLVAAEPGMGKTSLVTHLAREAKERDDKEWVIRINLNHIVKQLKEENDEYFASEENVIEFLQRVETGSQLGADILYSKLTTNGNVSVYLDGFDEINPYYNKKVISMIKSLKKLKIRRIWITTRKVMTKFLEKELKSICYSMTPFSKEDQLHFFVKYWRVTQSLAISDEKLREFADSLLETTSRSISDTEMQMTGIPLQCLMLATAFKDELKTFDKTGTFHLPKRLNLIQLYERFVSEKIEILFCEKEGSNISAVITLSRMEKERRLVEDDHSYAAMVLLLSSDEIRLLSGIREDDIKEKVVQCFGEGKEWTGLIDGMNDGKPSFIHRTFAEYFLALWLSRNLTLSVNFISQRLFQPGFATVRNIFDRILAGDCKIHGSILGCEKESNVKAILKSKKTDINETDKGGRTALHLAASYAGDDSTVVKLLLDYNAFICKTDRVLNWTPLRYADKMKAWTSVELFLKKNSNSRDLVETRSMITEIQNSDSKDESRRVIISSAIWKFVELGCFRTLKFAVEECKLDVNVDLFPTNEAEASIAKCKLPEKCKSTLLHAAVRSGNEDAVKFLIRMTADLRLRDYRDMMAIHIAAELGHVAIVELLVNEGVDIDARGNNGMTPLLVALNAKQSHVIFWLLRHGSDPYVMQNIGKWLPDFKIIAKTFLKTLIPKTVEVKRKLKSFSGSLEDGIDMVSSISSDATTIHKAAHVGDLETIQRLSAAGDDIDATTDNDWTPLHYASQAGKLDTVKWLVENGADIDAKNDVGMTSLHVASAAGHLNVVEFLAACEADVNARASNGWSSLHYAASGGHLDVVQYLSLNGADVKVKDDSEFTPVHYAAQEGNLEIVKCLFENGADVSAKAKNEATPLHYAAHAGNLDLVVWLAEAKVDVNAQDENGETVIHYAIHAGHLATIKWLNGFGANVSKNAKNDITSLHFAAKAGYLDTVEWLYANGANMNAKAKNGQTPLMYAAQAGNLETVKWMSQAGADRNDVDKIKLTALHHAAIEGRLDVVEWLAGNGGSLNAKSKMGLTPLAYAALTGNTDIVQSLFDSGADLNPRDNFNINPLHYTAIVGHQETLHCLLKAGADFNVKGNYANMTPLHFAAVSGNVEAVKLLHQFGADINAKPRGNTTTLHYAAQSGNVETVTWLIEAGASLNAQTDDGRTPVHYAVQAGRVDTVKLLADSGADIDMKHKDNLSPLHFATISGQVDVVRQLAECDADLDTKAGEDWTPLHYASYSGHLDIVTCLHKHGADLNATTTHGTTPVHLAAFAGHLATVKWFSESGADLSICDEDNNSPLDIATKAGHETIVKFLTQSDGNVAEVNSSKEMPSHYSAIAERIEKVKWLSEGGIQGISGKLNIGRMLLSGESSDIVATLGNAVQAGYLDVGDLLSGAGSKTVITTMTNAIVSGQLDLGDVFSTVNKGTALTALGDAVKAGHLGISDIVSGAGTMLSVAAKEERLDMGNLLSGAGKVITAVANIASAIDENVDNFVSGSTDSVNSMGSALNSLESDINNLLSGAGSSKTLSALEEAKQLGFDGILSLLSAKETWSCLANISQAAQSDASKIISGAGKVISAFGSVTQDGQTLMGTRDVKDRANSLSQLHRAARTGNTNTIKSLLARGNDINAKGRHKKTPLHYSAEAGHLDAVRCLTDAGADVHARDDAGNTALHLAVISGHVEVAKWLLQQGTDPYATDKSGNTALSLAQEEGLDEFIIWFRTWYN